MIDDVAALVHANNQNYCRAIGDDVPESYGALGDQARHSLNSAVQAVIGDPDTTPEQSHERWVEARVEQGWTYGATLDRDAKIHPNLVPYHQLPAEQQAKDIMFIAIVLALAPLVPTEVAAPESQARPDEGDSEL